MLGIRLKPLSACVSYDAYAHTTGPPSLLFLGNLEAVGTKAVSGGEGRLGALC